MSRIIASQCGRIRSGLKSEKEGAVYGMEVMHIQEQIRNHIVENFLFGDNTLGEEDSFLEHGVVDSTGVLELVLFAEETFGITVDDQEILPENFDSISSLARYVSRKRDYLREMGVQGLEEC